MKAKEFKQYQNYALSIQLHDLDEDLISQSTYSYICGRRYTEEELEVLWNKEVISFDMTASDIAWAVYRTDGKSSGPKILHLYVSNLTAEEREAKKHQSDIDDAVKNLERLSGKKVKLVNELADTTDAKITAGESITIR